MIDVRAQFIYSKVCCEIHKHVFIINASILSEQKIHKKLKVLSETLKRFHFGYLRLVISCILIDCCLMVTKQIHVISTIPVQYANLTEFTFLIIVQMLNGKILQNLTQLTKFCKMNFIDTKGTVVMSLTLFGVPQLLYSLDNFMHLHFAQSHLLHASQTTSCIAMISIRT